MSREFKFRAWDKVVEKMVDWNDLHHADMFALSDPLYEVMQFTGLHDRTGKEICEGDILRTESEKVYLLSGMPSGKTSISLSVVIWKDDGWGYRFAKNIQNADYTNNFETKGLTVKAQYSEVVGNIYKNPELLRSEP